MFGKKKIRVYNPRTDTYQAYDATVAVQVLAGLVSGGFSNDNGRLVVRERKPFYAPLFMDGTPVLDKHYNEYTRGYVDVQRPAAFTLSEVLRAVIAGAGLELRADYVVGSTEPVVSAVKKAKAK